MYLTSAAFAAAVPKEPQVFLATDALFSKLKVAARALSKELLMVMQVWQLGPRNWKHHKCIWRIRVSSEISPLLFDTFL